MYLSLWIALLTLTALLTIAGTLELVIVSAGVLVSAAQRPRVPRVLQPAPDKEIVVVVPAHNEAAGIAATLRSLLAAQPAASNCSIVVVADNCTDNTANIARSEGVRVLERQSQTERGKGYALDFAFRSLLPERPLGFIVVDADAVVSPGFFEAFRSGFDGGADALQCAYLLATGGTRREAIQELAFSCFNFTRPLAREALGLSCGILGNGFGLRAELLEAVPYTAASIVEDLEYHLRLIQAGKRVRFLPSTMLRSPAPSRPEAMLSQRARWEGGRLGIAARVAPRLLGRLLTGHLRLAEPLLDLMLLPLGYHAIVLLVGLVASVLVPASGWLTAISCGAIWVGSLAVAVHLITGFLCPHIGLRHAAALIETPAYLFWKLRSIGAVLSGSRRDAAWVRTRRDRDPSDGGSA